jgi:hypothetical protein
MRPTAGAALGEAPVADEERKQRQR